MTARLKRVTVAISGLFLVTTFQNCSPNPDVPLNTSSSSTTSQPSNNTNNTNQTNSSTPTNPATPASCPATTNNGCVLSAQSSGNLNGTCSVGFSGTCSYSCSNGSWISNANSCTRIDPLTLISGTFTFHAGGNTGTITLQRSGNSISGTDNFPNFPGPGGVLGLTSADVGSVTASSANSGTIQFTRTAYSGLAQTFSGTWTTTDFVHVSMSGDWSYQGVPGGQWDASK